MYSAKVIEKIDNGKGYWNYLKVGVFQDDIKIGVYIRNYSSLYNTFAPFQQDGKDYAIYSPSYTCTRVMELPSCKAVGGEEPKPNGFCPVELYVPWEKNDGMYGFVSGCVWGDDSGGWKLEYLDLSVIKAPDCIGKEVEDWVNQMQKGEVLLLENLRFHKEEKENNENFAKSLAKLGDIYINDAFATAHRGHASNEAITRYVKECAAGFLLKDEIEYFKKYRIFCTG